MISENDWRLRGQEDYMQEMEFQYIKFCSKGGSLHTHCEFCWHKFMEGSEGIKDCSPYGYCSLNEKYWVCKECFEDFKDIFHWKFV